MTEGEWQTGSDAQKMLDAFEMCSTVRGTERKYMLLACHCCWRAWGASGSELFREAVAAVEQHTDEGGAVARLERVQSEASEMIRLGSDHGLGNGPVSRSEWLMCVALTELYPIRFMPDAPCRPWRCPSLSYYSPESRCWNVGRAEETAATSIAERLTGPKDYSDYLDEYETALAAENLNQSDAVRDIFGNPFRPVAFSASWRTDTVVTLAAGVYESRDFSAMPILADALQDAGCDNVAVLSHCRGDGPHVRGCWVVDLVLGKK